MHIFLSPTERKNQHTSYPLAQVKTMSESMNNTSDNYIWLFHGAGGRFASGVFSSKERAFEWIGRHALTGTLTCYPINRGVYDWAIKQEYFTPKKEHEHSSDFIQNFTSASMKHYHFENGMVE